MLTDALLLTPRIRLANRAENIVTSGPRISYKNRLRTRFILSPVTVYLSRLFK